MKDTFDKETRSYIMSMIKGKDTKPEIIVRKFLFGRGFRYGLHNSKLTGKPDIVLRKYKTVVFVNGCFWHGHEGCKYFVIPKTRTEWWRDKINRNIERDKKSIEELERLGWKVLTVWECELKKDKREETLMRLVNLIDKEK